MVNIRRIGNVSTSIINEIKRRLKNDKKSGMEISRFHNGLF